MRTLTGLQNSAGYIGFRGETGVVWVRNVLLTVLDPPRSDRLVGERAGPGTGVTLPVLIRDARPSYTADAMRKKVVGWVLLEALVREDGTVGDVQVIRSLDRGLDEECANAVRQALFRPGTKDGKLVPVIVSFEHTFILR
jgi:TonB family protein